jgi:plasmid stabilization system protein ParE
MKSILDRTFRYTPSFETDLRKTFARIHRERRLASTVRTIRSAAAACQRLVDCEKFGSAQVTA